MVMESGKLDKRITLQANIPTKSDNGEFVDTWVDQSTVWAAIEPLSGRAYFAAQQANSDVTGTVRIRYRADVKPSWRIKYGNRYFSIASLVNSKEERAELRIMYKETLE
jgi:SPP1 family predicted phage head-tail adaptor